jgi:hypothetical protein
VSRSVAVITCAFTNNPDHWRYLRESAKINGLNLHVIGNGKNFPGNVDVFKELIPYVESLDDEYILLTDGYDVLVNRWNEDEVIELVDASRGLLVSCNDECWPEGPWCKSYPDNGTPWRTACAGQYVGKKVNVLWLWREFLGGRWSQECGGSTQEMMHRMYDYAAIAAIQTGIVWPKPFELDTRCQVFQIMGRNSQPQVFLPVAKYDGDMTLLRATNRITGMIPMFLHFGGRAPGMAEWFDRLYPKEIK